MFILLAILLIFSALPVQAGTDVDPVFGKVGLAFERNEGQVDARVKFMARSRGYGLFLTPDEAVMTIGARKPSVLRMKFVGQKRDVAVEGVDALPGTTNYLRGDGSSRTNIQSFKKVRYSEIYPGIDVEYHGNGRLLEYDLVAKPGSNPGRIRMAYSGVRKLSLNSEGELVLQTDAGPLVQKRPHAYQLIDGREDVVEASYLIRGKDVEFHLGQYDQSRPLIIDPTLVYSTFFGGTGAEVAFGIAVDSQGAAYVTGSTASTDLPVQSSVQNANKGGASDAFIFKLDPTGTQIVYATYIGGSATDEGHAIAVDAGGNAYVTGYTLSSDFPIVNGFQKTRAGGQDGYILKLNSAGTAIVYSTFVGGTSDDRGTSIALDAGNNAYVTGVTASNDFPTLNPYQKNNAGGFADGFVTKVNAAGSLAYSTYVGAVGNDNPLGIAVDGNGAAYVTGWTTSVNFPVVNAFQSKFGGQDIPTGTDDVFVLKLNPAGTALEYSTYIGGTGSDEATRIAVDSAGSAYVTGYTSSLNYPTVNPYQVLPSGLTTGTADFDAFVSKLSPDGKSLVFSTYFGGVQTDSGTGIAVDSLGEVYIAGYTLSSNLPTANQTQSFIGGDRDAFVAKFDPAGNVLVFSSFLGGTGTDGATGLALDVAGNAYIVGFTSSGDLPNVSAAQTAIGGGQDVFVAKLNVEDIVSSSSFQVAPQGASSVVTKGTRTDAVFGYAVAESASPGPALTGLAIIERQQGGIRVSETGIPSPPLQTEGRLFVDLTASGRSVLSIANPNDVDATVDFFYTDSTGATTQFATTTVTAHQHFSRFVTDDPLLVTAPGTVNFRSSVPVAATAFFTDTNESSELLISHTPIVDPVAYTQQVGGQTVTIPQFVEGAGWKNDVVLVNTTEDRMNGEVRFFNQAGQSMDVGIGDENTPLSVVEFDIPSRSFQKISTSGSATMTEQPFAFTRGTSITTPGGGAFQQTGFASADSFDLSERLNGMQIIDYKQLGITESQTGLMAPALRQNGRFLGQTGASARTFVSFVNPNDDDVSVNIVLTDDTGTSTDPVTLTVPAHGQLGQFLGDAPISMPTETKRTVSFDSSLPVFAVALRFFTNERSDSILSALPIFDVAPINQIVDVPHFADGLGWKTKVSLVNNTDQELRGEIHFLSAGSATQPPEPVDIGTADGPASVFEYHLLPNSYFEVQSDGTMGNLSSGSVQIVPFPGFTAPAAFTTVSQFIVDDAASAVAGEVRGNTVFETTVEGQLPASSLRFYAESRGDFDGGKAKATRTSIAIANPSGAPTTVQLEVRALDNTLLGNSAPITIPANGQYGAFLFQVPGLEALPLQFQAVVRLTVLSGSGVTGTTFRFFHNERSENLITTTGPLNENAGMPGHLVFPYVTDSTGYTTQFVLINPPGSQSASGILHYFAADGSALAIDVLKLGTIQIVPFGGFNTPHAFVVLNHRDGGVLTSIVGVEGQIPSNSLRMYGEAQGDFASGTAGATQSSLALANPSDAPSNVVIQMRSLDGTLLRQSPVLQVPANNQVAVFLNQIPGFETLAAPFEGVISITSREGITATAFISVENEQGATLFTTTGPLSEDAGMQQVIFPHIAEGGGYTTQFVVIGGMSGQGNAGVLRFFTEQGTPLNLTLSSR